MLLGRLERDARRVAMDLVERGRERLRSPEICAPPRSASNSRAREIAIWINAPAIGASSATAIPAIGLAGRPFSSRPPKNIAKFAMAEIAPAIVAVIVEIRMSRCFTCAAVRHHAAHLALRQHAQDAVVAATAACSGLRPVANAFGASSLIR